MILATSWTKFWPKSFCGLIYKCWCIGWNRSERVGTVSWKITSSPQYNRYWGTHLHKSCCIWPGHVRINNKIACDACIRSNITCNSFSKEPREQTAKPGDIIFSDVWGPTRYPTINKTSHYISFIDDYSWESVLCLVNTKDAVCEKYKLYKIMILHQRS